MFLLSISKVLFLSPKSKPALTSLFHLILLLIFITHITSQSCSSSTDCTNSATPNCVNNVCVAQSISSSSSSSTIDSVQGLILGSNLAKIFNYEALYGYDVVTSPLFYVVLGFTLVMLAISIWAALKDKAIDRDLLKLPEKAPSKWYKLMVYILITHTFFCIFVLFEKNNPRVMRSAIFYTKIMGLMAMSTVFNQNNQELSGIQRTVLAIITILITTPINIFASYIAFKRQYKFTSLTLMVLLLYSIAPKVRRKRMQRKKQQLNPVEEAAKKKKSDFMKAIGAMSQILGYISLILILCGYVYIIFVITANNVTANNQIVRKWLNGFLQSSALELFGVQIGKVFLHLSILNALQKSTSKKILCIPRKYLLKMLNPTIFDFQKRFATLEQLYKNSNKKSLPLPEIQFVDEINSPANAEVDHNGENNLGLMLGTGLAMNKNLSPGGDNTPGLSVRQKGMLQMRAKMKVPANLNKNKNGRETKKETAKNDEILEELSPGGGKSPVDKVDKEDVMERTRKAAQRLRGPIFIKKVNVKDGGDEFQIS